MSEGLLSLSFLPGNLLLTARISHQPHDSCPIEQAECVRNPERSRAGEFFRVTNKKGSCIEENLHHQHHLVERQRNKHQVCHQHQNETEGAQQSTELVRQCLEPQAVSKWMQQPWVSEQQLIVSCNGSHLAGKLSAGSGRHVIMGPGAWLEHNAVALTGDLHGYHDVVQQ